MLSPDNLTFICRESIKLGYKCIGEADGDKIYKVEYETTSYYVNESCTCLYIVYNDNFEDYDTEILDLGTSKVMKHFKMLKEAF